LVRYSTPAEIPARGFRISWAMARRERAEGGQPVELADPLLHLLEDGQVLERGDDAVDVAVLVSGAATWIPLAGKNVPSLRESTTSFRSTGFP
jgi:hypothetical protein